MRTKAGGRSSTDCTWEEFKAWSSALKAHLEAGFPAAPGARFGLFSGKVLRAAEDFVMPAHDLLLGKQSVVDELSAQGFELRTFDTNLTGKNRNLDYKEIWAPPVGLAAGAGFCGDCERGETKLTGVMNSSTIPTGSHFLRLKNSPNFIVLSEQLVNYISAKKYVGLTFKELFLTLAY